MDDGEEDLTRLVRQLNTSAGFLARRRSTDQERTRPSVSAHLDALLESAVSRGASDLLLVAGYPPSYRVNGHLVVGADEPLTVVEIRTFSSHLIDGVHYKEFQRDKASDFTVEKPGIGRFRCDLHHQQGTVAIALRVLPHAIPSLSTLGLPEAFSRFAQLARGLVLFCGPTGCGKSTSMASILDLANRTRAIHIITIEDPVEFVYERGASVVEQIEIGRDAVSFASALRHALRQDPDIILVGEMRDLETIAIALTAAETGHLVFSTVHTSDAAQSIDRLIDVFPEYQQNQIRQQISLSLAAIVVQTLVPAISGVGRVPATEILLANDAVRNLIRSGKNHLIYNQITIGRKDGMMTMEDALAALVKAGKVAREEALLRTVRPEELSNLLA